MQLNIVFYAPDGANIRSISAATKRRATFSFAGDSVLLNGVKVGMRVATGLYQALLSVGPTALVSTNWNERLGQPGETATREAAKVYGFDPEDHAGSDAY